MKNHLSLSARVVLSLIVTGLFTGTVCRADTQLDPTFGIGGKVTTDFASNFDVANGVAIQADGKIVVVGRAADALVSAGAVARYNPDGTLDTSFGGDGLVTATFPAAPPVFVGDIEWFDVVIQPDGRIVTAGLALTGFATLRDFTVARYNSDGSLDTNFGTNGLATTPFPFNSDRVGGLALQADGKIVVAGLLFVAATGGRDFALIRYNSNGSLDTGFGANGIATVSFPSSADDSAQDLAIQADGKIVAAGAVTLGFADFALARFDSNGSLDTSFGSGGRVTTDFGSSADSANDVVIQPDGKILAAGQTFTSLGNFDFALARYNPDGSLDSSFGTNGRVATDFGSGGGLGNAVVLQADGKIVLAGAFFAGGLAFDFALARYNPDGSLDGSFGTNGMLTTDFASSADVANAVALQADGKVVAAGNRTLTGGTGPDFAVARYEVSSSPEELVADLLTLLLSFDLPHGIENSFVVKLEDALAALEAGDTAAACDALGTFISHAQAQAGKKLTTDQANQLVAAATEIRVLLGCP